jgi:hypothetical protein
MWPGAEVCLTPATTRPCPWAGREGPQIGDKRPAGIAQNEYLTTFFSDNGRARTRIRRVPRPAERVGSMKGPQEPRLSTRHRAPGAQVVPQVPRKIVTILKFFINIKGQTELNCLRVTFLAVGDWRGMTLGMCTWFD